MKKIFTIAVALIYTAAIFTQVPQKMSYQAIIRNGNNGLVISSPVGMKITILQGSAAGTVVYQEIYNPNPQTNSNGLVTLEIGGGIPTGVYTPINWMNGPYFIKSETDPTGGTNYTITGTSQVLSVPYAYDANVADSLSGGIKEKDPVFEASVAKSITASDTVKWNTVVNSAHYVGERFGGGIVYYVYAEGHHGLIVDTIDLSTGIEWSNGTAKVTGAMGNGVGSGAMNTAIIIASQMPDNQNGSFAALICANYSSIQGTVVYGGWYLPSATELGLLFGAQNMTGITLSSTPYWSSSEYSSSTAWQINSSGGGNQNKTVTYYVRAVRAF
jgi:hypothetical protein